MYIKKVVSKSMLVSCRKLLAKDPATNVLPLGDLYAPLFCLSDVYAAFESSRIVGVLSIYHAYSVPSMVVGGTSVEAKQTLVRKVLVEASESFITLCSPEEIDIFKDYAAVLFLRKEQQMITDSPSLIGPSHLVSRVRKEGLEQLSKFYADQKAEAWTPIQFKTGPYYCVVREGKIVSAAGVHLVTPQIAQLGNIITDKAWRGRGFGTACTATLAADLASRRKTVSLFVRSDNAPAVSIYEKIGFRKFRSILFVKMKKNRI